MKTLKLALAAAASSLLLAGAANAQDEKPTFAFNVGAATDYVFRGISQTDQDPQIYGGVDAAMGMAYAGVWASNVSFGNGTDAEVDLYAGVKPKAGPVSFDIGVIYYGYIDQPHGSHQDYFEGKVLASVPVGPATIGGAVYWSPEFFGKTGDAWYYEANAAVPIPNTKFSVSGAVGRQTIDVGPSYTTWNAGVGYALTDKVSFDLRYWDTAKDKYGDISSSRFVGGFKVTF